MADSQRNLTKTATFRVPKLTWQRAKKRAIDEERSLNDVVVKALNAFAGPELERGSPMNRLLESARRIAARQPKGGPRARTPTKDELHQRAP